MKKKERDFDINIYGEQWRVCFISPILVDGSYAYGLCDRGSRTIYIDSTLQGRELSCTFFHELFHAYWGRMGIINTGIPHMVEEIIGDQFGMLIAENFDFDL